MGKSKKAAAAAPGDDEPMWQACYDQTTRLSVKHDPMKKSSSASADTPPRPSGPMSPPAKKYANFLGVQPDQIGQMDDWDHARRQKVFDCGKATCRKMIAKHGSKWRPAPGVALWAARIKGVNMDPAVGHTAAFAKVSELYPSGIRAYDLKALVLDYKVPLETAEKLSQSEAKEMLRRLQRGNSSDSESDLDMTDLTTPKKNGKGTFASLFNDDAPVLPPATPIDSSDDDDKPLAARRAVPLDA